MVSLNEEDEVRSAKTAIELEVDYLKNWLNKEKDPVLGTVIAQLVGLREIDTPEKQLEEDSDD